MVDHFAFARRNAHFSLFAESLNLGRCIVSDLITIDDIRRMTCLEISKLKTRWTSSRQSSVTIDYLPFVIEKVSEWEFFVKSAIILIFLRLNPNLYTASDF